MESLIVKEESVDEQDSKNVILFVDDIQGEVWIDGRGTSDGSKEAGRRTKRGFEGEMIEGTPIRGQRKKQRRHITDIDGETSYIEHRSAAKRNPKNVKNCSDQDAELIISTDNENSIFACTQCQRTFTQKVYLARHLMTHTGEKPYACTECGKKFSQKVNLHRHIMTHTGEKPYKCNICKAEFIQKANLDRHIATHAKLEPFKCELCCFSFSQKASLNRHMMRHTGEAPFKCLICHMRFSQKVNLKKHYETHITHSVKSFKCLVCDRKFSRKVHMMRHYRAHSGVPEIPSDDDDDDDEEVIVFIVGDVSE